MFPSAAPLAMLIPTLLILGLFCLLACWLAVRSGRSAEEDEALRKWDDQAPCPLP